VNLILFEAVLTLPRIAFFRMFRISIDVGGTFTDLVAFEERTGQLINLKIPSVPRNPEKGVTNALTMFLLDHPPNTIKILGHATTIATNALLGQIDLDLPKSAMITTKGFRDVVEIGRQRRAEVYNLFFQRPKQLISRKNRFELDERIEQNGLITKPIEYNELAILLENIKTQGVESLAIAFLNSYANSKHELKVAEEARKIFKYVTASCEITNEYREYERFSTAIVNTVLMPIMSRYINCLISDVKALGVDIPIYIMQSNGGLSTASLISVKPCTVVESGPAAGVIASAWIGKLTGELSVISFDMGGTTAKAGTVRGLIPEVVPEYEVAGQIHMGRILKGSGYPVRFPFIDLAECSSGGGTITWADNDGTLKIGPISAGAFPGPACYGRGGNTPTITDANLLLGRLNPKSLLNGEMIIYPEKAKTALETLSRKVSMDLEETAVSILLIANSMMGKILRIVSVERGYDPRDFSIVAFGGAGPMHVCALADELNVKRLIIPPNPGMFSALGLLTTDLFHDYTYPVIRKFSDVMPEDYEKAYLEMKKEAVTTLTNENVTEKKMKFYRQADIRYLGQGYELPISIPSKVTMETVKEISSSFHAKHLEAYGYSSPKEQLEVINLRLRAIGVIPKPKIRTRNRITKTEPREKRPVFFESLGWVDTPIYERTTGIWKNTILGPAIVEQYDATTVIYPDWVAKMDQYGNLILRRDIK